jgi:hypothetical protein
MVVRPTRIGAIPGAAAAATVFLCGAEGMESTFRDMHAAPAYCCVNPVTGWPQHISTHVDRAARMEPVAPPPHLYAGQPSVAMAVGQGVTDFTCGYAGQTLLPKGYGTYLTHHVRRCGSVPARRGTYDRDLSTGGN